jgi:hypothetical protein
MMYSLVKLHKTFDGALIHVHDWQTKLRILCSSIRSLTCEDLTGGAWYCTKWWMEDQSANTELVSEDRSALRLSSQPLRRDYGSAPKLCPLQESGSHVR